MPCQETERHPIMPKTKDLQDNSYLDPCFLPCYRSNCLMNFCTAAACFLPTTKDPRNQWKNIQGQTLSRTVRK